VGDSSATSCSTIEAQKDAGCRKEMRERRTFISLPLDPCQKVLKPKTHNRHHIKASLEYKHWLMIPLPILNSQVARVRPKLPVLIKSRPAVLVRPKLPVLIMSRLAVLVRPDLPVLVMSTQAAMAKPDLPLLVMDRQAAVLKPDLSLLVTDMPAVTVRLKLPVLQRPMLITIVQMVWREWLCASTIWPIGRPMTSLPQPPPEIAS
jgi:hypothetical protein